MVQCHTEDQDKKRYEISGDNMYNAHLVHVEVPDDSVELRVQIVEEVHHL